MNKFYICWTISILNFWAISCLANDPVWSKDAYNANYMEHGYPWENSGAGVDNKIPAPWTPIRFDKDERTVSAGVSEFYFGGQVLPSKISVKNRNILSKPISLTLYTGGQKISLGSRAEANQVSEESALFSSIDSVNGLSAKTSVELMYDGFLLVDVDLSAPKPVSVDSLQLDIGLLIGDDAIYNSYIDYDYVKQKFDRGTLGDSVVKVRSEIKDKFTPHLTIENSEYGMEWLAETNSSYSLQNEYDAVSVNKNDSEIDLKITMINKRMIVDRVVRFQFALFVIPSRPQSRNDKFYVSRSNVRAFEKSFSNACCIQPIYFGNRRRVPFEIDGLPNVAKNKDGQLFIDNKLPVINGIGGGYAPYTAMHLLSSEVDALDGYQKLWESSSIRRKMWSKNSDKLPITYEHKSIADYIIYRHSDAIRAQNLKSIYHDVAGMTSLNATMKRALTKKQIRDGVVYYPFFGFREFARRYWKVTKNIYPELEIVWHTGAILPKSISTYTDKVVFGESFHFLFSSLTTNREFPEYNPNYFALNESLFDGPLHQKNGFSYMLLPQIIRKENKEFSREVLKHKTRSLLAFSLLNQYPVWGTRLMFSEYRLLLDSIDKFGGIGVANFELSSFEAEQGSVEVGVYRKQGKSFIVVVNVGQMDVDSSDVALILNANLDEKISPVDSSKSKLKPLDYMLYVSGAP